MYYLCIVIRRQGISSLGVTPVSSAVIASFFPDLKASSKKVESMERAGEILRLKRDLYVVSGEISGFRLSDLLIANHLYGPSYVSMQSALRYYGLIPEAVYAVHSMTIKHARSFVNAVGRFDYIHISREAFHIGLTTERSGEASFVIATPEKALCDLVACSPGVNLRYKSEAMRYLEDDLRFDMDALTRFDRAIFEQYIGVGKKSGSIRAILKLL